MKRILIFIFLLISISITSSTVSALQLENLKLNGFFDLQYQWAYSNNSHGDTQGSFEQHHFNILLEMPVNNRISVKGHIEFEHSPKICGDCTPPAGSGDVNIEWAYFEYLVNNNSRLRGGAMLTPFGLYNEIHDATPTYVFTRIPWGIYRPDLVGGTAMFPKFSTGLALLGEYFPESDFDLNYTFYIANGENDTKNEAELDENNNKAVGGRIMMSPIYGLSVGGSFYNGEKGVCKASHSTWAGSLEYLRPPFHIQAEYASSNLSKVNEISWYGEVSYLLKKATPYIRYAKLDPDNKKPNDEWSALIYGFAYKFQPNVILKIENRMNTGSSNNIVIPDNFNEAAASIAIAF